MIYSTQSNLKIFSVIIDYLYLFQLHKEIIISELKSLFLFCYEWL